MVKKASSKKDNDSRVKLDEILKSLFGVSKKVLIQMMNSLFKENFDLNMTDVTFENNEFISDEYDIIRGDLFLKLLKNEKPYHYHIELQTKNDSSMVIRMFEYGFKKAKEIAKYNNDEETIIYIPKQLVIFIEQNLNIKDELKMRLIFPDGQEIKYIVSVMKYWQYDAKTLIKEKMYPLLPLQIFNLRYKMENIRKREKDNNHNLAELTELVLEAKKVAENIALEAKAIYEQDEINGDDLHKVLLAIANLFEYLNNKYGEDKKLVEEVFSMTRTLYDPVVAEKALAKGRLEGKKEEELKGKLKIIKVAKNLLAKGMSVPDIIEITDLSKEEIEKLKKE